MSDGRNQRPPGYGGGRGSSFFDSFFGGDPFAHMDQMFRGMGMGGDLFGGFTGGTGTFQARHPPSSTAREIPIEGPGDHHTPPAHHRLTGPVIDELPDHEQQAGHLFFSSPDHVQEPEEEEPFHAKYQEPPPHDEPAPQQQQQQQQPGAPRAAEPSHPQAAPVPPPPWRVQQRYDSSSSSSGGERSAEELLAAMGSLPLGAPHAEPPPRQADRQAGWEAGGGGGGGGGESEAPGSPLLVHLNNSTSPFSPQRGAHLLDADRLPPHLPAFGSLDSTGGSSGMAVGGTPLMPQNQQPPPAAAAAPPADWLAEAFGAGAQPVQAQQAAPGRPASWDEHAGMFVATPVSSAQPSAAVQQPSRSPGEVGAAGLASPQQGNQGGGGGGRSADPPGPFRSAGAGYPMAGGAAAPPPPPQQLADGADNPASAPRNRQRRLPAKLREAVDEQLQWPQPQSQQGAAAGRQRRAAAGRKRHRGSSEEEEEAARLPTVEEEDPEWAVPRRPRAPSASGGRTHKHGRRGAGSRTSRGHRR